MTQSPTSERIRLADEMRDEYCLMDTIDLSEWCREAMEQLRADEADIAELSIEFDEALAEVGRLNLMLMQHEAEIADLRARLAEAEKGAKRYAWLRDTSRCDQQDAGVDLSWYGPNDADFDGLIDQAMQRSD